MGKIKSYQQLEHSDCGLTCIRVILRYYGLKISMKELKSMIDFSRVGISIGDIKTTLEKLNFKCIPIKIDIENLKKMPLPAIVYWNQEHYVVLYKITNKFYYIVNPSLGKIKLSHKEFEEGFAHNQNRGIAILAEPTDDFSPHNENYENIPQKLYSWVKNKFKKNSKQFLKIFLFSLFAMLIDLLLPISMTSMIDKGIGSKDINLIVMMLVSQLFIFLGSFISNNVVTIILTKLGLNLGIQILKEYLIRLITFPMSFYERCVKSDLIQKMDDLNRLKGLLIQLPNVFFINIFSFLLFSALLIYYNTTIFIIFMSFAVVSVVWNKIFMTKRREYDYSTYSYSSKNKNIIYEMIYGMMEIKSNNSQIKIINQWDENQNKLNDVSLKSTFNNLFINGGNTLFNRVRDLLITGISAIFVASGDITMGVLVTIGYITGRLSSPIDSILGMVTMFQDAIMSYERVEEVVNSPSESHHVGMNIKKYVPEIININYLSFKYPGSNSPDVLKNITFSIRKGEMIAIVGKSGCGKSTLLKLILGLYEPSSGDIYCDGISTSEIDENVWLQNFGFVMQDGMIFSGSILSNIAFSDEKPDLQRVNEIIKLVCLDKYIETLPMGIYTKIGTIGLELSGGQKQRLLIARALYRNPDILILDEATSSLDAINENIIVNNINDFRKNKTIIIAAHRLSTVKRADKILMMDNGEIIESGTHNELLERKQAYYNLVSHQLENPEYRY